jgi:hypothetical protein
MKLFTRYLNSAAAFAPPDDTAAARQAERDAISVESMKPNEEIEGDEPPIEEEVEGDKDEENEDEEEVEEPEKKEETAEEKEARIAEAKELRKADRQQKRIDKAVASEKEARAELEALRKQMAENPKEGLSEEEVERRAEEKATKKLEAKQKETEAAALDKAIDSLATQGNKADKDFDKKVDEMAKEVAQIPLLMIEALADLDNENGGEVLAYLANNVEEYEEFFGSDMKPISERKMVQKLIRISDKVKETKKVPPKAKTKVPAPVGDVSESGRPVSATLTGKEDMDSFVRTRNKQIEERRKAQGY